MLGQVELISGGKTAMKIVFKEGEQRTDFAVTETSDKEIIDKFIDYETGYLIVFESNAVDPSDTSIYCTVVDPNTGAIIEAETRKQQVDSRKQVTVNEARGLKATSQRVVDVSTGQEVILEELVDLSTEEVISTSKAIAFSPQKEESIIEAYSREQEEEQAVEKWWNDEYPKLTFEEKRAFWLQEIYHAIRMQGEMGYAPESIFDESTYREWRAIEPEMDAILDYVIPKLVLKDEKAVRKKVKWLRRTLDEG
jgi:hypothetical protein